MTKESPNSSKLHAKSRSQVLAKWLDGVPMVIVDNGRLLQDRMDKARVR